MTDLPSMPLFVDAYEADTAHLTLEEDGAYNRLLRLCWRTPGCSLPDDPQWIRRRMRVDEDCYSKIVAPLLDEFFTREKGRVFQKRQQREHEYVTRVRDERKRAGSRGGKSKALKSNDNGPSKATDLPHGLPDDLPEQNDGEALAPTPTPTPTPTVKEKIPSSSTTTAAPARSPDDGDAAAAKSDPAPTEQTIRERVLSAIGADPVSGILGPNGVMLGGRVDMLEVDKWQAAGASDALILAVVRDRIAKLIGQGRSGPKSFKFFTDEILDRAKGAPAEGRSQPPPKRDLEEIAEGRRQREEIIRNMRKNDADEINNLPPRVRPKAAGGGGA